MQHPNFLDRIFTKINPRYLHPHQLCHSISRVYASILHGLPQSQSDWQLTDGFYIETGSILNFLGLAKSLHLQKSISPDFSVFEIVKVNISDATSHPLHPGDTICISSLDRKYIYPLPHGFVFSGVEKSQPAIQKS